MSKEFSHFPEREERRAQINERGAEKVSRAAQLLCEETVELAFDSVELHLQADAEQHQRLRDEGYPVGEVQGYFVLQDKFTAPREGKAFQRTFSVRLEPSIEGVSHHYMKLHVPAGDVRIQTYEMPPKESVNEVYIEATDEGETHWYAVQKTGMYEYVPYVQEDEDSFVLSDQGIWQWLSDRIPENGEKINKLLRRAVNWQVVPQRMEPIRELPPEELED